MSEVTGKAFDLKLLRKIGQYIKPYKGVFVSAAIMTIILGGLTTARPILIRKAIDEHVVNLDGIGLRNITMLMIGLLVLEAVFQFFFIYAANFLGQSIIRDIRIKLFRHIHSFRLSFFDRTPIGTLVTRTVSDIETIADIFAEGVLVIFGDLFKIFVMVLAMFYFFDWKLVLVSLSVVPVLYYATRWFQIAIKKTFADVRNQVAALNAFVQEHITGINIVQMFNREKAELEKFKVINDKHRKANIRSIWYFSIFLPVIEVLSAVSIGLAVWYGGLKAAEATGEVSIGDLTAMILFINMLYRPLRQLADRFNTLQMGMVSSDRVLKLLDDTEHPEEEGELSLEKVEGRIEFKNVHFSYIPDEPILRGVNLVIEPGQTMAIVGATGAGKSTIISLLMGFYRHQAGEIMLDGVEIKNLKLEELRKHFALVLQDVFLFSDTIENNITLREEFDLNTIREAAKAIGIDDFIMDLPGEYNYDVKERGGMLSAGQRQLLSFLRAYITNPPILILDEATSSIDSHTEQLIQNATEVLTKGRTSIVIAHRLATIQKADQIVVMEKGQVVEVGKHDDLLALGGYYARLYEMQFKERESA